MKVSELIESLSKFPSEMLVVVNGSDSCGYEDVSVTEEKIMLRGYDSMLGKYEDYTTYEGSDFEQPAIKAVLISKL